MKTDIKDVVAKSIIVNKFRVPKYLVIGTMSAGKSTFLNSMLGHEIFPAQIDACTAKVISYYANPAQEMFIYLRNDERKAYVRKKIDLSAVRNWNEDETVNKLAIEGPVPAWNGKSFCVVDTPGPNNSMDKMHARAMLEVLESGNYHKIIYLLNASQLGTEDDQRLLGILKEKNKGKEILFVVNKSDVIDDTEEENLHLVSKSVDTYLSQNGFQQPKVFFVSSLAALLALKKSSNLEITRKEARDYQRLAVLMEQDLSDFNLNVRKTGFTENKIVNCVDPLWKRSGIREILHIL